MKRPQGGTRFYSVGSFLPFFFPFYFPLFLCIQSWRSLLELDFLHFPLRPGFPRIHTRENSVYPSPPSY